MSLLPYEISIFKMINQTWVNPTLDVFFVAITNADKTWAIYILAALFAAAVWFYYGPKKILKYFVVLALTAGLSDLISYRLIKPLIARPRPSHMEATHAIVRVGNRGGTYGFTSNHAANSFGAAYVLADAFPKAAILFYAVAALIGYSRVYVGVHFLGDVIGGGLLGLLVASMVNFSVRKLEQSMRNRRAT